MQDGHKQAVTGVVPPQRAEALIQQTWPGVTDVPVLPGLAKAMMKTGVLAPLAWLLLAPCYFKKVLPVIGKRYRVTNRRVMICRGLTAVPQKEVPLNEIESVRLVADSYDTFYRTADIEILSKGQVALTLEAVSDPESFLHAIRNAVMAWGSLETPTPGSAPTPAATPEPAAAGAEKTA